MAAAAKTLTARVRCAALLLLALLVAAPRAAAVRAPSAVLSASSSRIVSVVPAVTEMLYAMGAGDAVVGVSTYDHVPADVERKPKVGALLDPNFELILTLHPDLVVAYGTQTDFIAKLERAHVPVYRYEHAGLPDILTTIRELGARIGRAPGADMLAASIERDLDAVRRQAAARPRVRTLLIFGREPGSLRGIYASGGYGFLHDLLELAGGDDVFGDVKRQSVQINSEQVLARAPAAIIELHDALTPELRARALAVWSAVPSVPAVRDHKVILLSGDFLTVPGPRVAQAARAMAEALRGGAH